jgi:aminopeptidase N
VGKWYLTDFAAGETQVPDHRVDLIFYAKGNGYRGAVLLRTGQENPLASVYFDGVTLRFQMAAQTGKPQTEMPWFVATLVSGRFEGYYHDASNATMGPKLKLVRLEK